MLTGSVNPLTHWPKVRRVKPGMLRVKGRCISTNQWLVIRLASIVIVFVLLTSVLFAAVMPSAGSLDIFLSGLSPILGKWIELIQDLRWWLGHLLTKQYPGVGRAILYTGTSSVDWHLLIIWILLMWLRKPLRYMTAVSLGALLAPMVGARFKVSFTHETVVIHRWVRSLKLRRHDSTGVEIMFRESPSTYQTGLTRMLMRIGLLRPSQDNELILVTMIKSLRPVTIVRPRKQMDAEKIVQSLQLAMKHSQNLMEKP